MQISDYLWQRARPESPRSIRHRRHVHRNKKINIRQTPVEPAAVNLKPDSAKTIEQMRPVPQKSDQPNEPEQQHVQMRQPRPVRKSRRIRVRIDYHDADTGKRIANPTMISGHPGERLALNYPQLEDWIFARIVGFTPTFPKRRLTIVLYYVRVNGAPVIVYHRDQDGQLLCPPEHLTGPLDADYTASCLNYFKGLVQGDAQISGQFTKHVRVITFTYHIVPVVPIKLPDVAYVELLTEKEVYESPASNVPLPAILPQGTFWRVFAAAQTTTDHQVWLSLGGAQWLTNTNTRAHQQNPFLPR
ncbi:MucBP domain-containing protein [Lacticaseibacillus hulanensis]|uniref:MucBP domain-containing protein n=1 Tax=Lacticaseibacillus hulanensis TaxID=2493111 RepID=UPI000FDBA091|nr:MucBP domain-containing protein [Lacticaseibacillus hulanensis]